MKHLLHNLFGFDYIVIHKDLEVRICRIKKFGSIWYY